MHSVRLANLAVSHALWRQVGLMVLAAERPISEATTATGKPFADGSFISQGTSSVGTA